MSQDVRKEMSDEVSPQGSQEALGPGSVGGPVLVLCRDLLLSSQIKVAAGHAGIEVLILRDPAKVASAGGRKLIVDCNLDGAVAAGAAYKCRTGQVVIGFVAHTDGQTIDLARKAGFTTVVARSGFFGDVKSYLE